MKIKKFIISGLLAVSVVGCGVFSGCSNQNETSSFTPPVIDQTVENTVEEEIGMSGIVLMSAQITTDEYETYGVSENALKAYTLTATYAPTYVSNALVDWDVSFVDPDSEWATGKTVTDYITVTPETDGALLAVVACFAAFEEDIQVTVMSRTNPDVFANCLCVYIPTDSTNPDTGETGGGTGGSEEDGTGTTNPDTGETGGSTGTTNPDTGETDERTEGSTNFGVGDLESNGNTEQTFEKNGILLTFHQNASSNSLIIENGYARFSRNQTLTLDAGVGFAFQSIEFLVNDSDEEVPMTCDVGILSAIVSDSSDTEVQVIWDSNGESIQIVTFTFTGPVKIYDINVVVVAI